MSVWTFTSESTRSRSAHSGLQQIVSAENGVVRKDGAIRRYHALVDEEHATAIEALGLTGELANLNTAARVTERVRADLQDRLTGRLDATEPLDVLVFGSIAREEATTQSDVDYLVVLHGLCDDPKSARRTIEVMKESIKELNYGKPGATGMFGSVVSAADITERIGLDADTNMSHSRRVLMLTESRSVFRDDLQARLIRAIVQRYLIDYEEPKDGPPRFLLNDVMRYWRTVAVDYQAKLWMKGNDDWGLRYLKLITSRKLSYAGALVPLLTCNRTDVDELVEAYRRPSLARLSSLALRDGFDRLDELARCLVIADRFAGRLAEKSFREAANEVTHSFQFDGDEELTEARADAEDLQTALEAVFFDSELLSARSRRYLSF